MSWFYDLSVNNSETTNEKLLIKKHLPSRLNDNLRWRCQVCQISVSTHETDKHLKCHWSKFDNNCNLKIMFTTNEKSRIERPRTKKLERPTPNIKHPVIEAFKEEERNGLSSYQIVQKKSIVSQSLSNLKTSNNPLIKPKVISKSGDSRRIKLSKNLKNSECKNSLFLVDASLSAQEKNKNETNEVEVSPDLAYHFQGLIKNFKVKCYLCKNEFTIQEMASHESDCQEKWRLEHRNLSPNQSFIKSNLNSVSFSVGNQITNWNLFKSQLTPCPKCGRTFFPHRVSIHEKACRAASNITAKNSKVYLGPSAGRTCKIKSPNPEFNFVNCVNCGKKINDEGFEVHKFHCGRKLKNNQVLFIS